MAAVSVKLLPRKIADTPKAYWQTFCIGWKVSEIYNKVTKMYNKVSELEISSWNVLALLRSKVAYIGTGHILP